MKEETTDVSQVLDFLWRNIKPLVIIPLLTTAIAVGIAFMLPKKFKSVAQLNIQASYFQNPLLSDLISPVNDPTELQSQRLSLLRFALNEDFVDELGTTFGVYKPDSDMPRGLERELFLKSIEYYSMGPTTFQIATVAESPETARDLTTAVLTQMRTTLIEERQNTLYRTKEAIQGHVRTLGKSLKNVSDPQSAEIISEQLEKIEFALRGLLTKFSESHPDVVRMRQRQASLRAQLKNAPPSSSAAEAVPVTEIAKEPTQEVFNDLLKKLNYLTVVLDMEKDRQNVSYLGIIEQPTLPVRPFFPDKRLFAGLGMGFGVLLAALTVFLLEVRRNGYLSPFEASEMLEAPLLGELPALTSERSPLLLPGSPSRKVCRHPRCLLPSREMEKPQIITDDVALHITSGVLLVVLLYLAVQLVYRARYEPRTILLNPYLFIPAWVALGTLFTVELGYEYVLLGFELAAGILLGFAHPAVGVSFFLAVLLMRPWELMAPSEFMSLLPRTLAGLTMLSWLLHRIRTRDGELSWNMPCLLFLLFVVWLLISATNAFNSTDSIDYFLSAFIPVVALSFLILNSVRDRASVATLRDTVALSIAGLIVVALYLTWQNPNLEAGGRLHGSGMWSNSNDLAALTVLAIPLVLLPLFKRRPSLGAIAVNGAIFAILIYGLWLTQSRGAFLALAAGLVCASLCFERLSRRTLIFIGVAAVLPAILWVGIERREADLTGSSSLRLNYIVTGLKMVRQSPVFGVGPGNYPVLFERYTAIFDEWGQRTAHSTWVLTMSEGGVLALLLLTALFWIVLRRAWRIRLERPELIVALVAYGVAMSFLSHTYLIAPYLLMALALAAARVYEPAVGERRISAEQEGA